MSFYEECIKVVNDELNNFEFGIVKNIALSSEENEHNILNFTGKKKLPNYTQVFIREYTDIYEATIIVRTDQLSYLKNKFPEYYQHEIERFNVFLKSINLELTEETYFLISLLHEFGHMDYYDCLYKYAKTVPTGKILDNTFNNLLNLTFNFPTLKEKVGRIRIIHKFHPEEIYADKFAYERFLPIWNKVKHLV